MDIFNKNGEGDDPNLKKIYFKTSERDSMFFPSQQTTAVLNKQTSIAHVQEAAIYIRKFPHHSIY